MPDAFDAYHRWLGITPKDQPPHHYRLLGIDLFENDPEVIRDATERQMVHVRKYQLGKHSALSQKILNELATAKSCLLDPVKKACYDDSLRQKLLPRPTPAAAPPVQKEFSVPPALGPKIAKTSDVSNQQKTGLEFIPKLPSPTAALSNRERGEFFAQQLNPKHGPSRYVQGRLSYIVLGTGAVMVVVSAAIFAISGNRGDSEKSNSNTQIAQTADSNNVKNAEQSKNESKPLVTLTKEPETQPPKPDENEAESAGPDTAKYQESRRQGESIIPKSNKDQSAVGSQSAPRQDDAVEVLLKPRSTEIDQPQQQTKNNNIASVTRPAGPKGQAKTKNSGRAYSSISPQERFIFDLPTGKNFDSHIFDVDIKTAEKKLTDISDKLTKASQYKGQVILLGSPDGAHAWAEMERKQQDGIFLAYYNRRTPEIYAGYEKDKLDGMIKKWDDKNNRVYWCQYAKGVRHGYCCYFKDDILRALFEINRNKIYAVHLCVNSTLEKSFDSLEQAAADDDAKILIDEMQAVETELKRTINDYESRISDEFKDIQQTLQGMHSQKARDTIQNRMNQRGIQRENEIKSIRRQGGAP
jgi:hypothetical protein